MAPNRCCLCRKKAPDVSLHSFPKNAVYRSLWKRICNFTHRDEVSTLHICSNHFLPTDYIDPNAKSFGGHLRLKPNTFPSVSVPNKCERSETTVTTSTSAEEINKTPEISVILENPQQLELMDTTTSNADCLQPCTPPKRRDINVSEIIENSQQLASTTELMETTTSTVDVEQDCLPPCTPKRRRVYSSRYVGDITSPDVATPRRAKRALTLVQQELKKKTQKIKLLQQNVRRLRKKVSTMQDLLNHLKKRNVLSEDAADTIMDLLPDSMKQLIGRKLQTKKRRKYTSALRQFALTLQFYSSKAYAYVRKTWLNLLPHPSTLRAWYSVVDGKPGFTAEAFRAIGVQCKSKVVIVNIVIDEMAIREQRVYDKNIFYGGINLGSTGEQDNDNIALATSALVFMAVSVNSGWKVPLAYFLIKGLTGSERANLLSKCIELLFECGARVNSITFDGASVNLSMCQNLGANFNVGTANFKPWFPHPITKMKIYIFLDACHMIKLVRNTLGDKGIIFYNDSKINWMHIKELNNIQLKEGLHLATKISNKHIQFGNNRMNVKLATQTLSKSVSNALLFLKNSNYCPKVFGDCEGTSQFCDMFNNIFDLLNCRNKFAKRTMFNRPLDETTFHCLKEETNKFVNYIKSLKDPHGVKIIHSSRKTGFLGLIINLTNIFEYFVDVKNDMKYVLTFKFSQDFIETFFSAIRSRGGFNNNPNAKQFETAYKRLLIRNEIKLFDNSNCLADGLDILHASSRRSKYVFPIIDDCQNISADIFDHDYLTTMWTLNAYVENVIEYISGFVVKSLLALNICNICKKYLVSDYRNCKLIELKDDGKLIFPSKDVVTICKTAEKVFRENIHKIFNPRSKHIMLNIITQRCSAVVFNYTELIEHMETQDCLDNHIVQLIKLIIEKYLNIRTFHECKLDSTKNDYIRSKYHRLILFKNQ